MATRPSIRLNIISDLHLGLASLSVPRVESDVVILAGDIARPHAAVDWALRLPGPVIYVAGNHESYGSSLSQTHKELKRLCVGTNIHILDKDEIVLQGTRFLGATLWTDFMLLGDGPLRERAMKESVAFIRDFSSIRSDSSLEKTFTPQECCAVFRDHSAWLDQKLSEPFNGPTVVVTHHAPSRRSIHPRFSDSLLNVCFVSDAEWLLGEERVALWVHGHTHDSFDYTVNGTRVLCNPRGYARDGVNENLQFDPDLIVTLDIP